MWHLTKIPKVAHFYWGGEKLSYLRYWTVKSFQKLNPDWKIKIHVPAVLSNAAPEWDTFQQKNINIQRDYFNELALIDNVEIVKHNFSDYNFDNNAHEVHKSDFLRWHLLNTHGGVWSDFDILYTASITSIKDNTEQNQSVDTALCPLKPPHKHTVGFMMSSQNNAFFQAIGEQARLAYDPAVYQCMGSDLINTQFDTFESFGAAFGSNSFVFLDKNCVYSLTSKDIESFYCPVDQKIQKKMSHSSVIGFHWFAGHPISQAFENELTVENVDNYNNLLSTIIKDYNNETCN
jgi:hypothetical protein